MIYFQTSIHFDFAKDEIKISELNKLMEVKEKLDDNFEGTFKLIGHTDSIGHENSNIILSKKRIQSILNQLNIQGENKINLITDPLGEYSPITSNQTEEGRGINRRVELILIKKIRSKSLAKVIYPPRPVPIPNASLLTIFIKDSMTDSLIDADIVSKEKDIQFEMYESGKCEYWKKIEKKNKIEIDVFSQGYFHNSTTIEFIPNQKNEITILLTPIKEGAILNLSKVLFEGGKTTLLKESKPALKRLLKTLKENKDFNFEIGGHVNIRYRRASKEQRERGIEIIKFFAGGPLSHARAKTIQDYLLENGIPENRITINGYGNSQMPFPLAKTKEDQAANRRVEIKVTGFNSEKITAIE